ncbi:DUF262 domain-containing protein [Microvirgula aerodenitrificans]|uniref:DUF262 domain-containing protein n=1 Tax=Microvirgula aerodenitrificans TaxID=57480 RepID=UPI00146F94A7|nr:DUF262 domain-containing protein [Microvirgula aerodenitrificans]
MTSTNNDQLEELNSALEFEGNIPDNEPDVDEVEDEDEDEDNGESGEAPPLHYDITSYGVDFDVEGLVKRIKRRAIIIPDFQRKFVWSLPESSRFIESLLLGLPVPGIFLAQEADSGKMYVIDGQQRLLSLLYFFDGYFKPKKDSTTNRLFRLTGVQKPYNGSLYTDLNEADRENLNNSVLHATVVKQDSPNDGDTSMYHIFGRLNSGGRRLTPQEIRTAVYHGSVIDAIKTANSLPKWRKIFGPENDRMKDQELILRFFAMYEQASKYKKPMSEFLNIYAKNNQHRDPKEWEVLIELFSEIITRFAAAVPERLFRPVRSFNVAAFEACTVGLARALENGIDHDSSRLGELYTELFTHNEFKDFIFASTSNVQVTSDRLKIATEVFAKK